MPINEVITNVIEQVKKKVSNLGKPTCQVFSSIENINKEDLHQAARLKSQIDEMKAEIKGLETQYNVLKERLLDELPGDKYDKVSATIHGVLINKYGRAGTAKLNTEKVFALAQQKAMSSKLMKQVYTVDEEQLYLAMHDGIITYEEYRNCLDIPEAAEVLTLKIVDPSQLTNSEDVEEPRLRIV